MCLTCGCRDNTIQIQQREVAIIHIADQCESEVLEPHNVSEQNKQVYCVQKKNPYPTHRQGEQQKRQFGSCCNVMRSFQTEISSEFSSVTK